LYSNILTISHISRETLPVQTENGAGILLARTSRLFPLTSLEIVWTSFGRGTQAWGRCGAAGWWTTPFATHSPLESRSFSFARGSTGVNLRCIPQHAQWLFLQLRYTSHLRQYLKPC